MSRYRPRPFFLCGAIALTLVPLPALAAWPPEGRAICAAAGDQAWPQLAPDGTGGAIIAWFDHREDQEGDVFAHRVRGDGAPAPGWPRDGLGLATGPRSQGQPRLLPDGGGGAFIAWRDAMITDQNIRLQRLTAAGAVAPGWPAGGLAVCGGTWIVDELQLAADGAGGVFVVWTDGRNSGTWSLDVYAQRVAGDGTIPTPWPANGVPVSRGAGSQEQLKLAADGLGGMIATWIDYRDQGHPTVGDVYAQRLEPTGSVAPGWPLDGLAICAVEGRQSNPGLVATGEGGAIIVWEDDREGHPYQGSDIRALGVLASGQVATGWSPGGDRISPSAGAQGRPIAIPDGVGGAIVGWIDLGDGYGSAIAALRIAPGGESATGWPQEGLLVCRQPPALNGGNSQLALCPDEAGGVFFTWTDGREFPGGHVQVYAQHLDAAGAVMPGWEPDGIPIAPAPGHQGNGALVPDGVGGAVAVWFDGRQGNEDVYAQRLNASGLAVPAAFAVLAPAPNPSVDASTILFQLPSAARVSAAVFDASGQRVRTLERGREFAAGHQSLVWNGLRDDGRIARAGLYFLRLEAGALKAGAKIARVR